MYVKDLSKEINADNPINLISGAVSRLVDSIYPDYPICDQQVFQDIEPPRFMLSCLSTYHTPRLEHVGIILTCSFHILFDPGLNEPEQNCYKVAFTLEDKLRNIPLGESYRVHGENINTKYDEMQGVLHVFFDVTESLWELTEEVPYILDTKVNTDAEVIYK